MKETEPRYHQEHVEDVILDVLHNRGVMTTQDITSAVKERLDLGPADMARANKRENESKIDQIIANALQEKRTLCKSNLISRVGRGEFVITFAGQKHLAKRASDMKILEEIWNELGLDGTT